MKRIRNKKSKTAKKYKNLSREVEALKLQISKQKNRLYKLKNNKNSKYKKKKVRITSRELTGKLNELKGVINEMDSRTNSERGSINERIKNLNWRIRTAKNKRNKDRLIQERERLKSSESNEWGPRELHGAFFGVYRRYRIDVVERMDVETFFNRNRNYIKNLIIKETKDRAARTQAITLIRFTRDDVETVDLAFNSRMMTVYDVNDKGEIVNTMLEHMAQQIENPSLRNSKFVFDRILQMDIDFHRLNLTRGSSYIPLPDWLSKKKALIKPKISDSECFKRALIAAMKWEEIDRDHQRVSKLKRYEN